MDAAGWAKLGDGFCFATERREGRYRINEDWIVADLKTAKKACKDSPQCVGMHYDEKFGDYVLLSRLGTPNDQDAGRRTCYKLRENQGCFKTTCSVGSRLNIWLTGVC